MNLYDALHQLEVETAKVLDERDQRIARLEALVREAWPGMQWFASDYPGIDARKLDWRTRAIAEIPDIGEVPDVT